MSISTDILEKPVIDGADEFAANTLAVVGDELMVRVGPDAYADALRDRHAREMDFTGTPLKGFVFVAPKGFSTEDALRGWVDRAVEFVKTLPVK